jgi:hypothetical protein
MASKSETDSNKDTSSLSAYPIFNVIVPLFSHIIYTSSAFQHLNMHFIEPSICELNSLKQTWMALMVIQNDTQTTQHLLSCAICILLYFSPGRSLISLGIIDPLWYIFLDLTRIRMV